MKNRGGRASAPPPRAVGGCLLRELDAQRVLDELAGIAFAVPGEEGGVPIKTADKLRALELLYKHLCLDAGSAQEPVTVVDDLAPGAGQAPP